MTGHLVALSWFLLAQGVLIGIVGWMLTRVFPLPADLHAIRVAAATAFVLQAFTFLIARIVARDNVIAGWGLGVLVRFAVVALWAFLLVPALSLSPTTALIALVAFLFVSTVVEPLFLNR